MSAQEVQHAVCSPLCVVPPIELMRLGLRTGALLFDPWEHYQKQSFRNRYHILTANGVKALSIAVKHSGGKHVPSAEVRISRDKPWLRDHLRGIRAAYGSAPYYIHYREAVEELLSHGASSLGEFFEYTFDHWCALLGVELKYELSGSYCEGDYDWDLRKRIKRPEDFPVIKAMEPYPQVFEDRSGFCPSLSVIDLLFNTGPEAGRLLVS